MSRDNPRLKDIYFSDDFITRLAMDLERVYPQTGAAELLAYIHVPAFAG